MLAIRPAIKPIHSILIIEYFYLLNYLPSCFKDTRSPLTLLRTAQDFEQFVKVARQI